MTTTKQSTRKQGHDSVDVERLPAALANVTPQPSTAPGPEVIEANVDGEDWAEAIVEAWRPSPLPIKRVDSIPERTTEFRR